jgi:eukaryotic-like serine/threonine-protein kinase
MMLLEGQKCSHYRLVRLLKQGGMGQVYQAEDMSLQRQVAIKVIRTDFAHTTDQAAVKEAAHLFAREALAIARLDHSHILPLYDSGEEYINDTKVMYIVIVHSMEMGWMRMSKEMQVNKYSFILVLQTFRPLAILSMKFM